MTTENLHPLLARAQRAVTHAQMAAATEQASYALTLMQAAADSHLAVFDAPVDVAAMSIYRHGNQTYVRMDIGPVLLEYRPDPDTRASYPTWWAVWPCVVCRVAVGSERCIYTGDWRPVLAALGRFVHEMAERTDWTCPACRERARNGRVQP